MSQFQNNNLLRKSKTLGKNKIKVEISTNKSYTEALKNKQVLDNNSNSVIQEEEKSQEFINEEEPNHQISQENQLNKL